MRLSALAIILSFLLATPAGAEVGGLSKRDQAHMDKIVTTFMERYEVPGLALAVARNGRMIIERSYGDADREKRERVSSKSLFRIASISKPITAVAIHRLVELGKLSLDSPVFGENGILKELVDVPEGCASQITVEHLLNHTAAPEWLAPRDPMFRWPELDANQLIRKVVTERPIRVQPGARFAYSNFGYCVLGRVIEKVTGEPYDAWVKKHVLRPCNIREMRIAGDTQEQRHTHEVKYYAQRPDPTPYGMRVARMDAHGGWIASAGDLVRFGIHVDGRESPTDLIKDSSRKRMLMPSPVEPGYAHGWAINSAGHTWHMGSLPGTASVLVITADGYIWAVLVNTRSRSGSFGRDLDALMWDVREGIPSWRKTPEVRGRSAYSSSAASSAVCR